jgi:putative ABC transport system ATP-binding protein
MLESATWLEAINVGRLHSLGERWLLRDVCCCFSGGDRVAVTGPSGSGKTLLLRSLALLDPLEAGEIRWRGHAVHASRVPAFRCQVMYLHQRATLMRGSVQENLQQPFQLAAHRERRYDPQRIAAWLEMVGRDASFLGKRHQELSGGELQIAALLRAMQVDPHVLLLDEPTAALDRESADAVETLVRQWFDQDAQQRITVWVSHDHQQLQRVSDRMLRIGQGRLG